MSERDTEALAEVRLTDDEREALRRELDTREGSPRHRQMITFTERIIAARIEQARAGEVGRCGNPSPVLSHGRCPAPPTPCALPAGHAGWHKGDDGSEWHVTEARAGEGALRERRCTCGWDKAHGPHCPDCAGRTTTPPPPVDALVSLPESEYLFHEGEWWVRSSAARAALAATPGDPS